MDHMSPVSNQLGISVCRLFFNLACLSTSFEYVIHCFNKRFCKRKGVSKLDTSAVTSRGNCELKNAASAPPSPGQSAKKHLQTEIIRARVSSQTYLVMQSVPLLMKLITSTIFYQLPLNPSLLLRKNPTAWIQKPEIFGSALPWQ